MKYAPEMGSRDMQILMTVDFKQYWGITSTIQEAMTLLLLMWAQFRKHCCTCLSNVKVLPQEF
jgi:hypothetical protein